MARLHLNTALGQVRGTIDGYVFRQTPHGPVMSRRPDMSRVKWSPAQIARRQLMQKAGVHYRTVMRDPKQAARYTALAKKRQIPVSSLVMGEYLKRGGKK